MKRLVSIACLALLASACARSPETFSQEFWLNLDGSGSFEVAAPTWVWNSVKNVGDPTNLEITVTTGSVEALFGAGPVQLRGVERDARHGETYLVARGEFSNLNALVGHRAFPDLAVAWRTEGERIRIFGVWRRPPSAGTAQGNDSGRMELRFHLPSQIHEERGKPDAESGNVLAWRQDLKTALAGSPIDFGATLGTASVTRAWIGASVASVLLVAIGLLTLRSLLRRGRSTSRRPPPPRDPDDDHFLNYDPNQTPGPGSSKPPLS